jgi:hypothetical protein
VTPEQHRQTLGVPVRRLARLNGKGELKLVECRPIVLRPRAYGRLERVEEFPLLGMIELEILAGRGKAAAVRLRRDPLREAGGCRRRLGPAPKLRHKEVGRFLGHVQNPLGEEEADGGHEGERSALGSRSAETPTALGKRPDDLELDSQMGGEDPLPARACEFESHLRHWRKAAAGRVPGPMGISRPKKRGPGCGNPTLGTRLTQLDAGDVRP